MAENWICPSCQKAISENANFCSNCGFDFNASPQERISKHSVGIIIVVVAIIIGAFYLVGWRQSVAKEQEIKDLYVEYVKTGSPEAYPDKTYGEAFDMFFANPQWLYFESDKGSDIVQFEGDCEYRDVEVHATIQFVIDIDNNSFNFEYLDFNGVPQTELIKYALITKVFE